MKNTVIPFTAESIPCRIHLFGEPSGSAVPLIVMPMAADDSDLMEGQHERIDPLIEAGTALPHVLVVFETDGAGHRNWNDALSPWPAPALGRGQEAFRGNAAKTLDWIEQCLLPETASQLPAVKYGAKGLLGYSMAGLFSLWAMTRTRAFSVYGSCSGSLWYEDFCVYLYENPPAGPCSVYLSLGEREELTRNPYFSKVGDATRQTAARLEASPLFSEVALVWHPGGHTGSVGERIAAAQLWMKRRLDIGLFQQERN